MSSDNAVTGSGYDRVNVVFGNEDENEDKDESEDSDGFADFFN
jgi:hypothetical protein